MKLLALAYEPTCIGRFYHLVAKADEQGMVRLSVNECARRLGIDRKWIERRLAEMQQRSIIDQQTTNKGTNLTICNYAYYNQVTADVWAKSDQQMTNRNDLQEEKEGERERNVSPTPSSYKEKDKEREEAYCAKNLRSERERDGQMTLFEDFIVDDNPAAQNGTDNPAAHKKDKNEIEDINTNTAELYDLRRTTVVFNIEKGKKETFFDER